jgi:hypothetical protein
MMLSSHIKFNSITGSPMVMQKNLNIFASSQKDHMHAITKMNDNINMESTIAVPLVLFSFTFLETDRNVEISQLYIKRY